MRTVKIHNLLHRYGCVEEPQLKVVKGKLKSLDDKPVTLVDMKDETRVFVVTYDTFKKYKMAFDFMQTWSA